MKIPWKRILCEFTWHANNVGMAMEINDNAAMNDEEREIRLKDLLGDVFDLEFVG